MKLSKIGSGLALLAVLLAGTARGDITIQVEASSNRLVGDLAFSFNGHQETNILAGTLTGSIGGGTSFDTYCIDLYHVISVGSNSYSVAPSGIAGFAQTPPAGYTAAGGGPGASGGDGPGIGYLFSTFDPQVAGETGNGAVIDGAGLQVALWKMAYDGSSAHGGPLDLTTGNFQFLDSVNLTSNQHMVFAAASRFLSGYDGSQSGPGEFLRVTDHGTSGTLYQDLIAPTSAVPEPSSLALGVIGSGLLVGMAARRRLKAGR